MVNFESDEKYWIALSHLAKWKTLRKNNLIENINFKKVQFKDFFKMNKYQLIESFQLTEKEIQDVFASKQRLDEYSLLLDLLGKNGIKLININSESYPDSLKRYLKPGASSPLIYYIGKKSLLYKSCIAIVGSRNCSKESLVFVKNIVKNAVTDEKVVVSGFAKGIDRAAFEETLVRKGETVVVLPQGLMSSLYLFRKYKKEIEDGSVLFMSIFYPKSPWSVVSAMSRNKYIYGLSKEIYVAETSKKGGTSSGIMESLRAGVKVCIRLADANERNANNYFIKEKGCIPVDVSGKKIKNMQEKKERDIFNP